MLTSLSLHGALFAALALLIANIELPDTASPVRLLDVRLHQVKDHGSDVRTEQAAQTPQNELPEPANPPADEATKSNLDRAERPTPKLAADVPERADAMRDGPAAPTPVEQPNPAKVSDSAPEQGEGMLVAAVTVVAPAQTAPAGSMASSDSWQVTMPLSNQQQQMLDKRIRKWSETLQPGTETLDWEYDGQSYSAEFERVPAQSDMNIDRLIVRVSTEEDGQHLTTRMEMRRLAFSTFGQFVDRWDPGVQIHNDEMDGRFHSNSEIFLSSTRRIMPTFHGKVTTAARRVNTSNSKKRINRQTVFRGGLETGVRRIDLPKHFVPFPGEDTSGPERVHSFANDTQITFFENGDYRWIEDGSTAVRSATLAKHEPAYLFSDPGAILRVEGTVRGKVLVYSQEKIVITGNLVYAERPDASSEANHYLGLVSDKTVEIAPPSITGPGDLTINAAIYARRRFVVTRYRSRENAVLSIFGSLSAGSISATEPRYSTKIEFDPRLENMRPPGFPMSDRYEMESWDQQWQITTPGSGSL